MSVTLYPVMQIIWCHMTKVFEIHNRKVYNSLHWKYPNFGSACSFRCKHEYMGGLFGFWPGMCKIRQNVPHFPRSAFLSLSEMSMQKVHEREVEQKQITQKGFVGQLGLKHLIQHHGVFPAKENNQQ